MGHRQIGFSYQSRGRSLEPCSGVLALLFGCLGLLAWSAPAQAGVVNLALSDFVSADGTNPVPVVTDLDATLAFDLSTAIDPLDEILLPVEMSFTFANDTLGFNVTEVFFNIPDNVTSVSLTGNPAGKWELAFDNSVGGGFSPNGFGAFDLSIHDGPSGGAAKVAAGSSATFGIILSGTGTVNLTDFMSEFSEILPGDEAMIAAARFDAPGGGGNSPQGFGATNFVIPEPSTIAFLAICALFLRRRHSRKFLSE